MISFFHHVVARGGEAEEHWLNEGLSHIAEELASRVFERRYPAPLGRSTPHAALPRLGAGVHRAADAECVRLSRITGEPLGDDVRRVGIRRGARRGVAVPALAGRPEGGVDLPAPCADVD